MGYAVPLGQVRNYYILVRKTREKASLEKCRYEVNAEIDLKEMGCENVDSTLVSQNKIHSRALDNKVMKFVSSS
jgi:hypothetical protein